MFPYDEEKHIQIQKTNTQLGLRPHSHTGERVVLGKISWQEALQIAEQIRYRHHHTNYDALLREGVDKQEARRIMTPLSQEEEEEAVKPKVIVKKKALSPTQLQAIENLKRTLGL